MAGGRRPSSRGCRRADRLLGADARPRRARRRRPVLRPAILWNDQRTAAECAEIEAARRPRAPDRADREPRAHRLHGAEAPLAAPARARAVRADPARAAAEGLRALPPDRRARDRRRRRLRHPALRRRRPPLVGEVCAALDIPLEWLPPAHESTEIAGAGDQAAAALGVGIVGRGPSRSCSARRASSSRRCRLRSRPAGARARLLPRRPGTWHAMGVMLSAAGSFAWLRASLGAAVRRARRGGRAVGAGR